MTGDGRTVVLRVIDRLNVGGPAIHAVLTTRGLDPTRFRTVLVTGSIEPGEADMSDLADAAGIERIVIPSLGRELRPLRDLATALRLAAVVARVRPDVLHTHKAKAGALGRLVGALLGVPVRVHTFHGHVFHGYFGPAKTRFFLAVERLLARATHQLVVPAPALATELSDKFAIAALQKFTVVPLGFDLEPFTGGDRHRGALRRELAIPDGTKLVAIVGRMVPVKDHATFVAAAAEIARRRDDVHFVFVGGGELEAQVRAQVEAAGLDGRAHLLGWRRDTVRIYADLDVVALSSVNEGTPVTLIEAMAAGVPVCATDVGGVRDVLDGGRRGPLVPAKDPRALADAIEAQLAPDARARAQGLRAVVAREHGAERLCDDLARLYDTLLGRKTPLRVVGGDGVREAASAR